MNACLVKLLSALVCVATLAGGFCALADWCGWGEGWGTAAAILDKVARVAGGLLDRLRRHGPGKGKGGNVAHQRPPARGRSIGGDVTKRTPRRKG